MQPQIPELSPPGDGSPSQLLDVRAKGPTSPPLRQAKFESPFQILLRRKWLAFFIAAAVFTAIATFVSTLQNIYKAEATVLVERSHVSESFPVNMAAAGQSRLTLLRQQILSYDRLAELIERFHLYPDARGLVPLEDIVTRMQGEIQLQQQESSHRRGQRSVTAFSLSYEGKDPIKVAEVTNTLTDFFIAENVKARAEQASGTTQFLQKQLEKMRAKLEAQEHRISAFKEEHIGELPEQLSANLATLERLSDQLRLNSGKLAQANERRATFVRQLADTSNTASTEPVSPDVTQIRLQELYQKLSELRLDYSEKYPDVIRVRTEIATLEQQQAGQPAANDQSTTPPLPPQTQAVGLRQELSDVNAAIKALETEERNLQLSIRHYQARVETAPRIERQLQTLQRDYDTTEERYLRLQQRYEEAEMVRTIEQNDQGERFRVLVPATPPKAPVAPKRKQFYLAGLAISLALGAGVVFLRDRTDSSFHVVEDLRAFSPVPVLISLPRIETQADLRRKRWRFCLTTVAAVIFLCALAVSTYTFATGSLPPELLSLHLPLQTFFGS